MHCAALSESQRLELNLCLIIDAPASPLPLPNLPAKAISSRTYLEMVNEIQVSVKFLSIFDMLNTKNGNVACGWLTFRHKTFDFRFLF
jgi:hypothetical protein